MATRGNATARAVSRFLQGLGEPCRRCGSEHYREADGATDQRTCDHCGLGEGEDPPADIDD